MAQFVNLNPGSLRELHVGNERLVSYNVEMTEVTGGTFWKATPPLRSRAQSRSSSRAASSATRPQAPT